ncbi:dihydrodipicolinate synthase family protein [Shimia sp. MIT1388]|uniref:dihydrodipicolinate synthase family protein n=1 Tax=Shimia sp. MIT1388 TaxID=3096992 RepID=UPI00399C1E7E
MGYSLGGMYAALLTGFSDSGAFDADRQRAITEYVLRQGLQGLYIGGSSGESGLMSTDELHEQQEIIAAMPAARTSHVIAHVGQPNTRDSIALAQSAATLGFDALSALPPHAYPFSDEEIFHYYAELAAATSLPLIVYEVPVRTGRPLPLELLQRILDLPNVAGIKFTSTDLFKLSMLRRSRPDKIYFFGFDEIFAGAAALGCEGGIGTTYNVLGKLYVELFKSVTASDLQKARQLQDTSQRFVEVLLQTGVIPGVKAALRAIGVDAGFARGPLIEQDNKAEQTVGAFLREEQVQPWLA